MADIVLSAGVRSNLLQLQKTSELITATQSKLATGKRVNSALDNPVNFFTAQGLSNRASDLSSLLDNMSSAFNTIQAANNGITSITKLVQSAQALVSPGAADLRHGDPDEPVDAVRRNRHPDRPARRPTRASTASTCSTAGTSTDLTVTLNESGTSSVTIAAVDFSAAGDLDINNAANNWGGTADITAASTDLTAALTTLRSQAQSFGSNLSTVQIRQDFTKAMINTLQTGADALTLADSNEEGANLLALQTRQQLSTTALSLASQASQAVLRLF